MRGLVGIYRAFWAVLDANDPTQSLKLEDTRPILDANRALRNQSKTRCTSRMWFSPPVLSI
ncbi:hypothetical protein [Larkinella rosea]|uniref:Uncharacterized protein n=1 Tax=Larkinella rosea TaxID=2025312 RepID=A0A3P1B8E7_9BACT|nr:hypothetical protein [Larkinella rosea]RRA97360.1 hypothetical protein EHT25_32490 [Larkinella rosea]